MSIKPGDLTTICVLFFPQKSFSQEVSSALELVGWKLSPIREFLPSLRQLEFKNFGAVSDIFSLNGHWLSIINIDRVPEVAW